MDEKKYGSKNANAREWNENPHRVARGEVLSSGVKMKL